MHPRGRTSKFWDTLGSGEGKKGTKVSSAEVSDLKSNPLYLGLGYRRPPLAHDLPEGDYYACSQVKNTSPLQSTPNKCVLFMGDQQREEGVSGSLDEP